MTSYVAPRGQPHNVEICSNLVTFVFLGPHFVQQCLQYGVFYDTLGIYNVYIDVCSFSEVIILSFYVLYGSNNFQCAPHIAHIVP